MLGNLLQMFLQKWMMFHRSEFSTSGFHKMFLSFSEATFLGINAIEREGGIIILVCPNTNTSTLNILLYMRVQIFVLKKHCY